MAKLDTGGIPGSEAFARQMWKHGPKTKPRGKQEKGLGESEHYMALGWLSYFSYQTE